MSQEDGLVDALVVKHSTWKDMKWENCFFSGGGWWFPCRHHVKLKILIGVEDEDYESCMFAQRVGVAHEGQSEGFSSCSITGSCGEHLLLYCICYCIVFWWQATLWLFDDGSTAGFVKQLKQNNGYIYLVVEELVSFFDPSYTLGHCESVSIYVAVYLFCYFYAQPKHRAFFYLSHGSW